MESEQAPKHGHVIALRSAADRALRAYRQGLIDIGATQGAVDRVEAAIKALGLVL